jgi:glycosyltransferase involved in cell wall biosynthesis
MDKLKLVSIIVPVFNRKEIVKRTLISIAEQTYTFFECIIVDDFSTDGMQEEFKTWNLDDRFKIIKNNRKKGAQGARNTGIILSKGDYICLFDSDNLMQPNFLEEHMKNIYLEKLNIISICHSQFFDSDLIKTEQSESELPPNWIKPNGRIYENLLEGNTYADFNEIIFPRAMFERCSLLDESIVAFQELDFVLQSAEFMEYKLMEVFLVKYIIDQKDSISNSGKSAIGRMQILIKNKDKYINTNLMPVFKDKNIFAIKALIMNRDFLFLFKIVFQYPDILKYLCYIIIEKQRNYLMKLVKWI